MTLASLLRLVALAAIWGGSFLFLRMAAPSLGPAVLIEARVGLAALSLLAVALYLKRRLAFGVHMKHFFIIGLFNSALPFLLFAYAAQTLGASSMSILNSTTPIWGAVIGAIWYKSPLTPRAVTGLLLGIAGVAVLVGPEAMDMGEQALFAVIATLAASMCYGIASNYTKQAPNVSAFDNSHGSMWAATLLVLPLLPLIPMREAPGMDIVGAVVALGVVCTGIAYLMFFRLIDEIGAASTLTVTFLIPLFGILWGHWLLDEPIGSNLLSGACLVITGTMLVTGFSPRQLLRSRARTA